MSTQEKIGRDSETDTGQSAFGQLGLTTEEIASLKRQGFVSVEIRGGCTIYKLRFRVDRRQRVRYLGTDPMMADAVRQELDQLRQQTQLDRRLRNQNQEIDRFLRESKRRLEPLAAQAGLKFHGRMLRRPRTVSH